jgi:hypothetical protein
MKIEFKLSDDTRISIEEFSDDSDNIDNVVISFKRWDEEKLDDVSFTLILSTRNEVWEFHKALQYIAKVV